MRRAALVVLVLASCHRPPPAAPLVKAGDAMDDGHGQLANASMSLMTPARVSSRTVPVPRRYRDDDDIGDTTYGGPGYGGASYTSYRPPPWAYPSAPRTPGFATASGLTGVIEGTITWRGASPTLTTACGAIEPVRVGAGHALAGAVVYIEHVRVGRAVVHANGEQRPYTVGGTVLKRGCELVPRVQLVSPVPAALTINGDATPAQLAITLPGDIAKPVPLEAGGRVVLPARAGITRVETDDHTIGAAWAIGSDSPYFALTDDRGRYRIEELAPGSYELTFWYPPLPKLVDGKLVYGAPITVKRTVRVDDKRPARLDVTLAP